MTPSHTETPMQRHAYLIMAHNNWYTLEKLIRLLDVPWNDIYLHIDKKVKDFSQEYYKSIPLHASIHFTKRHSVTWGNETQVRAEMTLFKAAYRNGPYHYYHFLSGQDLPLKDAKAIYDFFENKNCNFLHTETDVTAFEWRLKNYINIFRSNKIPQIIRKRLNAISEVVQYKLKTDRLAWLKAHYPNLGKGHNWCDLTQGAVEKLMEAKKDIRKFTRDTHCSDEMYKQIVLLNQSVDAIGPITDSDIRYIDWSEKGNHPKILTIKDYNSLIITPPHSQVLIFARKFDDNVDREIIDEIYHELCNK